MLPIFAVRNMNAERKAVAGLHFYTLVSSWPEVSTLIVLNT